MPTAFDGFCGIQAAAGARGKISLTYTGGKLNA